MDEPAGGPQPPDPTPPWSAPDSQSSTSQLLPPPPAWAPAPHPGPRPEQRPVVSPPGHPLYVAYAIVMMLSYVATATYGYFLMRGDVSLPEAYSSAAVELGGRVVLFVGAAMALFCFVGIVAPKRPWGWVYKLVLICIGLTSCCTWPVTIPLFKKWLKPDMKRYYRMR